MAKKIGQATSVGGSDSAPATLNEHIFYGLKLDPEQKAFRNAIWDKEKLIVFCDAKAGTGKTLIAIATGMLAIQYGLYDGLTYISSTGQERHQGYLPGTQQEKSAVFAAPLCDALVTLGYNPDMLMDSNIQNQKNGTAKVELITPTYQRGTNLCRRFVIYDEAQNASIHDLKKMLTRIHDDSKIVVIGHRSQRDIFYPEKGFEKYLEHFADQEFAAVCTLSTNHRGKVSSWADELVYAADAQIK